MGYKQDDRVAINRATKFSSYFLNSNKSYMAKVQIGTSTDTDDAEETTISLGRLPIPVTL